MLFVFLPFYDYYRRRRHLEIGVKSIPKYLISQVVFRDLKGWITDQVRMILSEPFFNLLAKIYCKHDHLLCFHFGRSTGNLIGTNIPFFSETIQLRNKRGLRANCESKRLDGSCYSTILSSSSLSPIKNSFSPPRTEVRK